MLRESLHVSQIKGDHFRRRFVDELLDLLVWYESDHFTIYGFQLRYDPENSPRVVTSTPSKGLSHARLESGEDRALANRSPILVTGGEFHPSRLLADFRSAAVELGDAEKAFVEEKLAASALTK